MFSIFSIPTICTHCKYSNGRGMLEMGYNYNYLKQMLSNLVDNIGVFKCQASFVGWPLVDDTCMHTQHVIVYQDLCECLSQ